MFLIEADIVDIKCPCEVSLPAVAVLHPLIVLEVVTLMWVWVWAHYLLGVE